MRADSSSLLDSNAGSSEDADMILSDIVCRSSPPAFLPYICVLIFTLCLIVINQVRAPQPRHPALEKHTLNKSNLWWKKGKFKQMPVMLAIAYVGYIVNKFSAKRFASNAQIAQTLGALAVGVLGNLY